MGERKVYKRTLHITAAYYLLTGPSSCTGTTGTGTGTGTGTNALRAGATPTGERVRGALKTHTGVPASAMARM